MVDVCVNFAGVHLKNPIILASGGPGWDGAHLKQCGLAGAGAVIPKSIGSPVQWLRHPRIGRMDVFTLQKKPYGMINLELFSTLPLERWLTTELQIASEGGVPIIASVVADPDLTNTQKTASAVDKTGLVSMIEVNVSCPMPAGQVGMHIGRDPKLTAEQVKAVKEVVDVPVTIKLSPNFAYLDEIARAAERAGADAISATNSVQALYGVDIEEGRPILPAYGGYSGPAIKPIALRCVAKIAAAVNIPISGIGGVSKWQDVVEYLMLGATTVQTCTAVMWRGLKIFRELEEGLKMFMERKNYQRIEEFRGIALKHLTTVEALAEKEPLHAVIDADVCTSCQMCIDVCQYDAIQVKAHTVTVDPRKCDGCGLCRTWCPTEAIELS